MEKFEKFVFLSVNPRRYAFKKSTFIFLLSLLERKNFSLLTLFNILIHGCCRNFDKNCIKTLKVETFLICFSFWCEFEISFFRKSQLSLRKNLLHNQGLLLSVLNILTHDLYRKFDKNCIERLKFMELLGSFSFRKTVFISS